MSGLTGNNILAGASGQATGYDIERSVVLDTNSYFTRTPSSSSNRKTWTWSSWVKISPAGAVGDQDVLFECYEDNENRCGFFIGDSATNYIGFFGETGNTHQVNLATTAAYRDYSGWYHLMVVLDTTQSTASNRAKIYINGEQVTDFSTATYPNQNDDLTINKNIEHMIGVGKWSSAISDTKYHGYMAEIHFIDGTALTPASFGETDADTNQWKAIEYEGSYGTNGFYLDFATRATDPIDASGNGNNWSSTNVIAGDWKIDSPTNNFATLNSVFVSPAGPGRESTLAEGNLKATTPTSGSGYNGPAMGTMGMSSGKWYFEWYIGSANWPTVGIAKPDFTASYSGNGNGNRTYGDDGNLYGGSSSTTSTTYTTGDIIGCAVDMDNGKMWFSKNGTFIDSGNPAGGTNAQFTDLLSSSDMGSTGQVLPFFSDVNWGTSDTVTFNAGQDSSFAGAKTAQGNGGVGEDFYYAPPTGFKAINTDNLDDPSIDLPNEHFNTVLYTGNGSTQSITGVGFQPDFTWLKHRNSGIAYGHQLFDSVRTATKYLVSNTTGAEVTDATTLTSFDSDGFSLGTNVGINQNTINHVGWNWKAGGTASSNDDGSYTSSVSANTTAGFSVVSYTANGGSSASFGHGLSQAPELVICKNRSAAYGWPTYNAISGADYALYINTNAAVVSDSNTFPDAPSSTVVNLGASSAANGRPSNTDSMIAYCWHSVEGYSKIGSYTGNGSNDGPFVYTGFRPAFLLIKRLNATGVWPMFDNKRVGYNWDNRQLRANETTAEETYNTFIDILSNGFKCKNDAADKNASGGTYIYLAFAESPFKYSNAR